jgi:hypothetical protein
VIGRIFAEGGGLTLVGYCSESGGKGAVDRLNGRKHPEETKLKNTADAAIAY